MQQPAEWLDLLSRHSSDCIVYCTPDQRVEWSNDAVSLASGFARSEIIGMRVAEVFGRDSLQSLAYGKCNREEPERPHLRVLTANRNRSGQEYWTDTLVRPVHDAAGNLTGYMEISTDVTEQRAGRLRLQAYARDNETLLLTMHQYGIVSMTDLAGTIIDVSDSFCRISGYAREELLGQNHRLVNSAEHTTAYWTEMWNTVRAGQPWRSQVCNRAKDGRLYWVDSLIAPFIGADGKIERFISIRTDITASKAVEEQLRLSQIQLQTSVDEAQAASKAKSQFVANMSHEIRTPMHAILGMLQLLQTTQLTAQQEDYAAKSYSAGRLLLKLLDDILDFSKIEATRMTLESQPLDLDLLCQELEAVCSAGASAKPLALRFAIDSAVPRQLMGDALRLQQVLVNLLGNAIKFTARGEVRLSIALQQLDATSATLAFAVTDTGIGIAPEHLAQIFDGFTQAEASITRRFGGTGLGLAIARRLVALMGGTLDVQSRAGQGSQFSFVLSLPLARPPEVSTDAHPTPASGGADPGVAAMPGGKPLQGMRILLVEDNPTNQQVACELLQIQGATVQLASDGRQGVRALQQAGAQGFDVVLMDLQMPEMDGFAATREIRATPGLQSLPIIAMTANAMDSDRDACLQAGMQAHIGKPFELQRLIQVLCSQTGWSAAAQPADVTVACSKALRHAADTAGADLQAALRRLGGDLALYTLTVAGLQTELRAFAAQLTLPEQACRQPELARQLHTIKGLAASAGLARLAEAARRTEAQVVQVANSQGCRTALGPMQRAIGDQLPKLEALHRVLMAEAAEDAAKVPAKRRSARHDDCLVALLGLKEQLILKNYDALGAVAIIQQDFGEVLGDDLDPLLEAMAELAFEAALQACQTLIDHMKP